MTSSKIALAISAGIFFGIALWDNSIRESNKLLVIGLVGIATVIAYAVIRRNKL